VKQLFGLHETQERDGANAISGASNPELSSTLSHVLPLARLLCREDEEKKEEEEEEEEEENIMDDFSV